ncbi:MAG: PIN domain nuclease [Acidobacteria bacterium]|nr:PIN domain nuclease [Acidobacteriota bacterium]
MRVLVDTSVWADFFNEAGSREADILVRLITNEVELVTCGVVIAEFFQGLRRSRTLTALERQFRDMVCLAPIEPETYFSAAELYRELRRRGVTVRSTIDCLIVQLAELHGADLLARDRDLTRILDSGLTTAKAVTL